MNLESMRDHFKSSLVLDLNDHLIDRDAQIPLKYKTRKMFIRNCKKLFDVHMCLFSIERKLASNISF